MQLRVMLRTERRTCKFLNGKGNDGKQLGADD